MIHVQGIIVFTLQNSSFAHFLKTFSNSLTTTYCMLNFQNYHIQNSAFRHYVTYRFSEQIQGKTTMQVDNKLLRESGILVKMAEFWI